METMPTAAELIEAASEAIRAELLPALAGRAAFQARVVLTVLDIARREVLGAPGADAAELAGLRALPRLPDAPAATRDAVPVCAPVDTPRASAAGPAPVTADAATADAELSALRLALCDAIREGRAGPDTPGLLDHVWAEALARVAIDQPTYPSFVREAARHRNRP
jgi:hypothetical protein